MRRGVHKVFEATIAKQTTLVNPVYSGAHHNVQIGAYDGFSMQAVLDEFDCPAAVRSLAIHLEESLDGLNWATRETLGISIPASQSAAMTQMWSNAFRGVDLDGPIMGFARFAMFFDVGDVSARVALHVATRE